VFPLIIVSPINTHMHHLLLGRGGVFFGVSSFWVLYYGSGRLVVGRNVTLTLTNKGTMRSFLGSVARQRPVSNNREVFSLGSLLRNRCHGKIFLLVRPELQEGEVGRSRQAYMKQLKTEIK
jgi:hypothetical protein